MATPHIFSSLNEQRAALDRKEISSSELTQAYLSRIQQYDTQLNSFITPTPELAMEQAAAADALIQHGESKPLTGIPYAAKDLFLTKGIKTTAASKILDSYIATYNGTVIEKVHDQHAVLLGKTNLDQFALGSSGETSGYGATQNPWDETRMPGGSSSGSVAAVAAGLASWALATETGGSIRQPASLTGLSGWKPTYGRVSRYGVIAMASSLDSPGVVAHSAADCALLAGIIAGSDSKDATSGMQRVPNYAAELKTNIQGIKIGVPAEYFVSGMEAGVKEAVEATIAILREQGAEIIPVQLPLTRLGSLVYAIVCPSEVSSNLARYDGIRYGLSEPGDDLLGVYEKTRAAGFGDEVKRRIMIGSYVLSAGYYDAYYKKAQAVRGLIIKEFAEIFQQVDALVGPASPNVALKLGKAAQDPLFGYIADQLNIPSSLAGLPAMSVPCGFSQPSDGASTPDPRGLPVGLQIIGPQWHDQITFDIAHSYQQVTDWHLQQPESYK